MDDPFGDSLWILFWQTLVDGEKPRQLPCTAVAGGGFQYLLLKDEAMKDPCSLLPPNTVIAIEAVTPPLPIKIKVESV